ncbi:MAG: FAD-dependent monooxygenase, partial [Alloprevotella sp.]|nr:FAD-dependent monooxygenase [Alloprevotella sp.]
MSTSLQLRVLPQVAYDAANLRADVAQRLGVDPQQIHAIRTVKRSIDARQRQVMVNLTLEVFVDEDPTTLSFERIHYGDVSAAPQAIVVGAGPGGLFAALRLVELGVRPIVLERGRDVDGRKKDLAAISRDHIVDSESNYSFGEGGAGAFSDGKLYT